MLDSRLSNVSLDDGGSRTGGKSIRIYGMSDPTPSPSSSMPTPSPSSATSPAVPHVPWWKNSTVLGIAGLIGAAAAVLALFRDTIDFQIGSGTDSPGSGASAISSSAGPGESGSDNYGWGPPREVYSNKEPSPTAVFNSIVDNDLIGDERNFVRCRIVDGSNPYGDEVAVQADVDVSVLVWIDNSSTAPSQMITGARMDLITNPAPSQNPSLGVILTGDNVIRVWNGCRVLSPKIATIIYTPGSGFLHTSRDGAPVPVKDAVVRGDTVLPGIRGNVDGVIGGGSDQYGYIEFRVHVFLG
ncbi:hypothetical protein ACWEKT_15335 [Nocardia takedensis]